MTSPTSPSSPQLRAVLTHDAVARLPRWVLISLCLAYIAPGFLLRGEPWKPEAIAFGHMLDVLAGQWPAGANLAHLLGAAFAALLTPAVGLAQATRLPFMLLLAGSFALLWYACFAFARHADAQPASLPFGGEPHPIDFARTVADGCLLGFIACLGLADRGHQAIPELAQLFCIALLLYALATLKAAPLKGALLAALALGLISLCGAPRLGLALALLVALLSVRSPAAAHAAFAALAGAVICALVWWQTSATLTPVHWPQMLDVVGVIKLAGWFWWPLWLVILYGVAVNKQRLARWQQWHVRAPLSAALLVTAACLFAEGSDQVLLLSLPPLAIVAAGSLPFVKRSALAVIDWFALFFYTALAVLGWGLWSAWHLNAPAKPAANLERLYPGLEASGAWPWQWWALVIASIGTLAWLALIVWRTRRVKHPLWKGMVLSAGGVTIAWLLLHTLGAPLMEYSRSYSTVAASIDAAVPEQACVQPLQVATAQQVLLRHLGRLRWAQAGEQCDFALVQHGTNNSPRLLLAHDQWQLLWSGRRPSERDETFSLLKRKAK